MITLETRTGKVFQIAWAGVSGVDGAFRFAVIGATMQACYQVFSDPSETETLTRVFDEDRRSFEGYSVLKAVDLQFNGIIIVALVKEGMIQVEQAVEATEPEVITNAE